MTLQINTQPEVAPVSAPAGHDDKMVALFDARQTGTATPAVVETTTTPSAERPAWLPEKFKSAEDFAKSYAELEKKVGAPATTPKPTDTPAAEPDPLKIDPAKAAEADAAKALEGQGLKMETFSEEYAKDGALSEASYETLAKAGIPKDMVDQYIAGQEAQAEVIRLSIFNEVGGEKAYGETIEWAKSALSPAEIGAYNQAVDTGSVEAIKLAAQGLRAKFVAANGQDPQLLGGNTTGASQDVYRSTAELRAAMSDPRYSKDEAYRADVAAKLGRSSIM